MNQKEKNSFIKRVSASEEGKLIYFLKQWITNGEDAKDIVQDVFYNLILGFEEIKDLDKITSWLYSTARFKAIDFIRKKKPTVASDLIKNDEDDNEIFEWIQKHTPADQVDELWKEEVYNVLENTLETLPEEQRDAFVLYELEGFSMAQIAELKETSVNTILSRKRYAVSRLKIALQKLYNELND
ncbi:MULTISPECIES: RNA polymerase sigma factor [Galbibacter]|uniref:RNA polymerase sigma factor n=1 Tax=Galbibacter pacificus TaxID=2996052 RepID=A0ABT6FUJ4_9FLAO|nr:RNA polymerase sigma factor [Galbibacter pacificus]MDG3583586.1 RNA polymerase sigma factor [Galbibacter pacificus]MDG3586938.1 RNA polymerase sigma factor [Galbibacter pacificus]